MADSVSMTVWTAIGSVAALTGTGFAIWNSVRANKKADVTQAIAKAAQASADALTQQVTHLEAMSKAAEQANKLSAEAIAEQRASREKKVALSAKFVQVKGKWWLKVTVTNNTNVVAHLSACEVLFETGHVEDGIGVILPPPFDGVYIKPEQYLPIPIQHGLKFELYISSMEGLPDRKAEYAVKPFDFTRPPWRQAKEIRATVNNEPVSLTTGDWLETLKTKNLSLANGPLGSV